MKLSFERELHLHVEDQPQEEIHGMEESTHAEPNIRQGRKRTTKAERLKLHVAQNVGVHTS